MPTIQKIDNKKGVSYRVLIRKKGLRTISKTFPSRKLANQFALQVESDLRLHMALGGKSNSKTFSDVSRRYRVDRYGSVTSTPVPYESRIKYWDDFFGNRKIIGITQSDIVTGLRKLPDRLSNASINKFRGAVSAVLSYACKEYDLPGNPVQNIPSLIENNARTRFLSDDERTRLFKACRASKWGKLYLLVLMAITTGARKGELLNLKFKDIDFDRHIAYVHSTKNGEPKVMPLTKAVLVELNRFKEQEAELIFNSELKPNKPFEFRKQWGRALKEASIEDFRFHDTRHSCASYLAMNGASLLEIADVLGHKQISMTKRYSHLCVSHKIKLIGKVFD